jgi:predicted nucleic acid-binding protein
LRRDELTAEEAQRLIGDLERVAVESVTTRTLVSDAVALAIKADITVYDATYLTLAVRLDTAVVTGDDRLARKVARHPALRTSRALGASLRRRMRSASRHAVATEKSIREQISESLVKRHLHCIEVTPSAAVVAVQRGQVGSGRGRRRQVETDSRQINAQTRRKTSRHP